ncbi:DUF302 domain-containing protein [bacterium]|nr:DUF302 domain-containing protein [bacterium]
MSYFFAKKLKLGYEEAISRVKEELEREGFGVLTEINVKETLKKKLGADFRPYIILGACNPHNAYKALQAEARIGLMLPCNVVVQQTEEGVEVSAVDPVASMQAVDNKNLECIAVEVRDKLHKVINNL